MVLDQIWSILHPCKHCDSVSQPKRGICTLPGTIVQSVHVTYSGLYSKHFHIVPVLVESWSGQVISGPL